MSVVFSLFLTFFFGFPSRKKKCKTFKVFEEFRWESPFQLLRDESEINWKYSNDVDFHYLSFLHIISYIFFFQFSFVAPIAIQANPSPWPIVEPVFHFGPGFDHPHYCPTHSQGPQPHEHIVFFHVNPGVSVTFQISGNREVIRGKCNQFFLSSFIRHLNDKPFANAIRK